MRRRERLTFCIGYPRIWVTLLPRLMALHPGATSSSLWKTTGARVSGLLRGAAWVRPGQSGGLLATPPLPRLPPPPLACQLSRASLRLPSPVNLSLDLLFSLPLPGPVTPQHSRGHHPHPPDKAYPHVSGQPTVGRQPHLGALHCPSDLFARPPARIERAPWRSRRSCFPCPFLKIGRASCRERVSSPV